MTVNYLITLLTELEPEERKGEVWLAWGPLLYDVKRIGPGRPTGVVLVSGHHWKRPIPARRKEDLE